MERTDEPLDGKGELGESCFASTEHLRGYLDGYAWPYYHRDDGRAMFELALVRAASR